MAGPATVEALGLPFDEAIAYLRDKVDVPTERWTDLWHGMHARAFVVAGATEAALLEDFHQAVLGAIENGTTLDDFRRDFARITSKHGWAYRGGAKWRAGVIFNTNLRMAYAAGKWAQIERLAERRPWLRYVAVLDDHTRQQHRDWHDTILPVDHPFWRTHAPPNGWNCRCTIQQLSDADLVRLGLTPSEAAPPIELEQRELTGAPKGILVPKGIDSGFAYNVGEAAWGRGAQLRALRRAGGAAGEMLDLTAPGVPQLPVSALPPVPLDPPKASRGPRVRPGEEAALRDALRQALGGAGEAIWTDPTGARVHAGQAIADHVLEAAARLGRVPYWPYMQELVESPYEIWLGWAIDRAGKVSLRRRYIKHLQVSGGRQVTLIADAEGSEWAGFTFFPGQRGEAAMRNVRRGLLIYRRTDEAGEGKS